MFFPPNLGGKRVMLSYQAPGLCEASHLNNMCLMSSVILVQQLQFQWFFIRTTPAEPLNTRGDLSRFCQGVIPVIPEHSLNYKT